VIGKRATRAVKFELWPSSHLLSGYHTGSYKAEINEPSWPLHKRLKKRYARLDWDTAENLSDG
jgi:hypothetical protein